MYKFKTSNSPLSISSSLSSSKMFTGAADSPASIILFKASSCSVIKNKQEGDGDRCWITYKIGLKINMEKEMKREGKPIVEAQPRPLSPQSWWPRVLKASTTTLLSIHTEPLLEREGNAPYPGHQVEKSQLSPCEGFEA